MKQAKQKKLSDEKFFDSYPYCKLDNFVFNIEELQENGKIIRDENGLHWIEDTTTQNHSHATNPSGKKGLNGWGISIFNDGKIF